MNDIIYTPEILRQLPAPPADATGWPWTCKQQLSQEHDDHEPEKWPRLTVVTPSYNQGQFLEQTIRSVLLQEYPNLHYVIIDGGSDDDSVEVIRKYEPWIDYWVSERDRGQSHAINKGFDLAEGEILCWLNSDDLFLPGTLRRVARCFMRSGCDILSGHTLEVGHHAQTLFEAQPCTVDRLLDKMRICSAQQSTFWTRQVWEECGPLTEDLHYAMDFDLWLRMAAANFEWRLIDETIAIFRRHEQQKTVTSYQSRIEAHEIVLRFARSRFYQPERHHDSVHRALWVEGWLEYAHAQHYTASKKLPYWLHWATLPFRNWRCLWAPRYYPRVVRRLAGDLR